MRTKLKYLLQDWPHTGVVTSTLLRSRSISPDLAKCYVDSGWIFPLGDRAFGRVGEFPSWQGGVAALQQQLKLPVHVGGRGRLHFEGLLHHVMLGEGAFWLFGEPGTKLPKWFLTYQWGSPEQKQNLVYTTPSLFTGDYGFEEREWAGFKLKMSTLERATLELLYEATDQSSFLEAEAQFPTLTRLDPKKMQRLLETCKSRRIKRLFLYLAEKQGWPDWFSKLNLKRIDLGSGPLSIAKKGKYISKWRIQVPQPWLEEVTV